MKYVKLLSLWTSDNLQVCPLITTIPLSADFSSRYNLSFLPSVPPHLAFIDFPLGRSSSSVAACNNRERTKETGRGAGVVGWQSCTLLSGKTTVYPQHRPAVSPNPCVWFCLSFHSFHFPAVRTIGSIWVTADITLCHNNRTLTFNLSYFL